jgi:outer membrane lipoprotein-sorting protein
MKLSTAILSILVVAGAAQAAETPSLPKLSAEQIVEKHVAAIGGLEAWRSLRSVVIEGELDAGGTPPHALPYVLKQKRGHLSRLEVSLGDQTAVQIFDGKNGWKVRPFTNRKEVETMTAAELAEASAAAVDDLDGPLVDAAQKGYKVALVGTSVVKGHPAYQLKLTSKAGAVRNLWLDGQNFMTLKMDGEPRKLDLRMHPVSIYFSDYRPEKGLQYAHQQETVVEQSKAAPTKRTVTKVRVNESIEDSAFAKPDLPDAAPVKPAQ